MTATVNGREYSRASLADIYWTLRRAGRLRVTRNVARARRRHRLGHCGTGCILELSLVHGRERFPWLAPGDVVSLSVERLGSITNRVVAARRTAPTGACTRS